MKIEKMKNATRNIVWGILNQIVSLGFPFFIRTIILSVLGTQYLGLNSLFASVLQVLNLSELGFSTAVIQSLYEPIAKNDTRTICSILNFYKKVYRSIGIIIMIMGIMLLPWLKLFIKGDTPDGINIRVLFIIYLLNTVIGYLFYSYKECLILAYQRNDLSSKRNMSVKIFLYILQILSLMLFRNYYVYIILLPISTILNNFLIYYTVKREYPNYIEKGNLSNQIKNKIKTQVKGLIITRIAATTRNSFDNIILSSFLGLTIVGVYGNYYYIMSSVQALLLIFVSSIQAGVGNSIVLESKEKNFEEFRKIYFLYLWLAGICTVYMLFIFQPFMVIWVGYDNMLSNSTVILICIYFYFLLMGDVPSIYINATGIWWHYKLKSIIESISNLFLNILLVKYYGLNGVILATLITRLLFGIIWGNDILFENYFGKKKIFIIYKDQLKYIIWLLFNCWIIYYLKVIFKIEFFKIDFISLMIYTVIPISSFILFNYKNYLFEEILLYIKINILRR